MCYKTPSSLNFRSHQSLTTLIDPHHLKRTNRFSPQHGELALYHGWKLRSHNFRLGPCLVWPTVENPPAKLIYDPVKRNTAQDLEGWISGPSAATIFHDYQAIPGGVIKHLILPHFPVCLCHRPIFYTLSVVGQNLRHFQEAIFSSKTQNWLVTQGRRMYWPLKQKAGRTLSYYYCSYILQAFSAQRVLLSQSRCAFSWQ